MSAPKPWERQQTKLNSTSVDSIITPSNNIDDAIPGGSTTNPIS